MGRTELGERLKRVRYAASFLRRGMVHVNLQVLYQCNFRCRICDFWKRRYQEMPQLGADQARLIADKLDELGPQIVSIGGGEPLMHPEIVTIARILSRRHLPVMITNGWFVTPELARSLFEAGMYEVSVSVDYAEAGRHDAQRGCKGAYDGAIAALEILQANRTRPYQRVHMISVAMADNLDEIEPLIRLCGKMGITYLVTLYSDGRGQRDLSCVAGDASARLLALKERYPGFVSLRGYLGRFNGAAPAARHDRCFAGLNLMNIDCRGSVSLCIDRADEVVGNLLEETTEAIRRKLLARYRDNQCRSCWTSCRGSIETLMYGGDRLANLRDLYGMTKPVPLAPEAVRRRG
ncbi:MAG: radical SAM protein [Acidobacteriota bacterium]